MLRITAEQMRVLRENAVELYVARVVEEIRARGGFAGVPPEEARQRAREEVARCAAAGVTRERDVTPRIERIGGDDVVPPSAPRGAAAPETTRVTRKTRPREIGDPAQPCLSFVEVIVRDDAGEPVAHERLKAKLPDGSEREIRVDGNGRAYLFGVEDGDVEITFLDSDVEKE